MYMEKIGSFNSDELIYIIYIILWFFVSSTNDEEVTTFQHYTDK